jgi:hypothetical protein
MAHTERAVEVIRLPPGTRVKLPDGRVLGTSWYHEGDTCPDRVPHVIGVGTTPFANMVKILPSDIDSTKGLVEQYGIIPHSTQWPVEFHGRPFDNEFYERSYGLTDGMDISVHDIVPLINNNAELQLQLKYAYIYQLWLRRDITNSDIRFDPSTKEFAIYGKYSFKLERVVGIVRVVDPGRSYNVPIFDFREMTSPDEPSTSQSLSSVYSRFYL